MATASPTFNAAYTAPVEDIRDEAHWYHLFRLDQITLVSLFFLLVGVGALLAILSQVNTVFSLINVEAQPYPEATSLLLEWPQSDWAFTISNEDTISRLTFGFNPPGLPDTNDAFSLNQNGWVDWLRNPPVLDVPTVDYMLFAMTLFIGGGLFGLLAQTRENTTHTVIYTVVTFAVIGAGLVAIGVLYAFLLPMLALLLAVLLIYLFAIAIVPRAPEFVKDVQIGWLITLGALIIPTVMVMAAADKSTNMVTLLASSFRLATPIVIGAMAGIWCERSGVVNIAIEGMMLTGACFGFVAFTFIADTTPGQSGLYLGILVAMFAGGLMALLHAWLSITFKTDQIISGTVINILALGLTSFMRREVLLEADAARETLQSFKLPMLGDVPIIGEILFTGKPIFFSMFILIAATHVMLFFTRWGLRTRAVGENPHAADTLGINVIRNRYFNVIVGGLIAGLAGAWFSLETAGGFDDNMTNGLGFIALAAVIFGKWRPIPAAMGGLLFGFSRALDTRFQILEVDVPVQFVQMTPYLVTIVVLAGLVGRAIAPRAVGLPYEKE